MLIAFSMILLCRLYDFYFTQVSLYRNVFHRALHALSVNLILKVHEYFPLHPTTSGFFEKIKFILHENAFLLRLEMNNLQEQLSLCL